MWIRANFEFLNSPADKIHQRTLFVINPVAVGYNIERTHIMSSLT